MSLLDLALLYALGGAACAFGIWRASRSWRSALLAVFVWPLWAPFAFRDPPKARDKAQGAAARVAVVLEEAREAAAGTPFETMLNGAAAARIAFEVERAAERLRALDETLAKPEFSRAAVVERLAMLEAEGASEAAIRPVRMHLESVERLAGMRAQQAAALGELEQVLAALRSQLVVARYAGASEGVDGILGDLWARVEGLGEALDQRGETDEPVRPHPQVIDPRPIQAVPEREAS